MSRQAPSRMPMPAHIDAGNAPAKLGPPASTCLAATAALTALTMVTAAGAARLFTGTSFLGPVLIAAGTAHFLAWLWRRWRLGLIIALVLSAVGILLVSIWTVLPETTAFGLPGPGALHGLASELSRAINDFEVLRAPAPVTHGFLLALTMAVGSAAVIADWLAFRADAPLEAAVPSFVLFIFASALGAGSGRVWATAGYLAALLAFLIAREHDRMAAARWFRPVGSGRARRQSWTVAATGCALAAAAIATGAYLGPSVPGASSPALINWHNLNSASPSARTTISPLVNIQSQLLGNARTELFRVQSRVPAYWRLTALDNYDGTVWSSDETYQPSRDSSTRQLSSPPLAHAEEVTQRVTITGLSSAWIPAAFRPVGLPPGTSISSVSSSIIASTGTTPYGASYRIESAVPQQSETDLSNVTSVSQPGLAQYLRIPDNLPSNVVSLAHAIVRADRTPYGKALALQQYFRSGRFHYSLNITRGHDENALERFLFQTKTGYCEQFAGSYAVLARLVGLPTRVAVGFTPGQLDSSGTYHVYGADAHAWPEVYFGPEYGWVAFEPTPGRGAPGATDYTGVAPDQAAIPTASTSTTSNAQAPQGQAPVLGPNPLTQIQAGSNGPASAPGSGSPRSGQAPSAALPIAVGVLSAAVTVLLAWLVGLPALGSLARKRRRARAEGAARVLVAWREATEAMGQIGLAPRRSETFTEYAVRAGGGTSPAGGRALSNLATRAGVASYSLLEITPDLVEGAIADAAEVERASRRLRPWWVRVLQGGGIRLHVTYLLRRTRDRALRDRHSDSAGSSEA